jgi:hypothetical protein
MASRPYGRPSRFRFLILVLILGPASRHLVRVPGGHVEEIITRRRGAYALAA